MADDDGGCGDTVAAAVLHSTWAKVLLLKMLPLLALPSLVAMQTWPGSRLCSSPAADRSTDDDVLFTPAPVEFGDRCIAAAVAVGNGNGNAAQKARCLSQPSVLAREVSRQSKKRKTVINLRQCGRSGRRGKLLSDIILYEVLLCIFCLLSAAVAVADRSNSPLSQTATLDFSNCA